ncbi:hypothetical protein 162285174 [Organic Lake phycodnavirus 1]|nr:hypothetical protein 162285174 [Organic Lake phycodnavirus 1]
MAFYSDNDGKLKSKETITFTTNEKTLITFFKHKNNYGVISIILLHNAFQVHYNNGFVFVMILYLFH